VRRHLSVVIIKYNASIRYVNVMGKIFLSTNHRGLQINGIIVNVLFERIRITYCPVLKETGTRHLKEYSN